MECPVCKQAMKKVRWHISYNPDKNNREYDYTTYQCINDDVWVNTEIPVVKAVEPEQPKQS